MTATAPTSPPSAQTKRMNSLQAMNSALRNAFEADEKVLLLGEDVADPAGGAWGTFRGLSTEFSTRRVRSTPIAEQAILGAAIGASIAGYRPVADIMFSDFLAVCADQLANHAAKMRYMSGGETPVPITVTTHVGTSRFGAQHSQSLEAWFMHVPGIKVVMPSNPYDAKGLLISCILDEDPCLFMQPASLVFGEKHDVPIDAYTVPLGKAAVRREGTDMTIVSYGPAMAGVLDAAETLGTEHGISAEVIDLRSLMPLDMESILGSVGKTKRLMVVHNATEFAGPGAEIASQVHEELFGELEAPVMRVGGPYAPMPFSVDLPFHPLEKDIVAAAVRLTNSMSKETS